MDSSTSLVVKVSYGGVLRRFRVPFKANRQIDLDMVTLRGNIASLFNLPLDDGFSLTYSDEDGDVVALVDDNDLFDVNCQPLKFLKINVESKTGSPTKSIAPESRGASPGSKNPVSVIQKGVNDVMKAVPNPIRDSISKVYIDLTSEAAASSPVVGELFDCISKLGKLSVAQEGTPSPPVTKPGSSSSREVPVAGEKKDVSKKKPANNPYERTGVADSKTRGKGASFNECPFSGGTVNYYGPNPMYLNKYPGDYWTPPGLFHKGIQCDGCDVVPITGPRFKSKVKEDYDLCSICYSVMGNKGDYTRIDIPASVKYLPSSRGKPTPFSKPFPVQQQLHFGLGDSNFKCTWPKLDSIFVLDVSVPDGTAVDPSAPFTKIWRMRNNGSVAWPRGTQIAWIGGYRFSNSFSVDLQIPEEGVPTNSEFDVKVDLFAPKTTGRYISHWMMASSTGVKFGQRVSVLIYVDAAVKRYPCLDLNDFPVERLSRESAGNNVNQEPAQTGSSSANNCWAMKCFEVERVAAESQIPEKDDLLVGKVDPVITNTLTPSSSSSSFNMVELPNMPTVETLGGGSSSTKDVSVPLQEDKEKNNVMITMLKELEEMGFKETDLNKEILRENEYNLEQSVEALCEVGEWDPILEELQEMGFGDDVTNKRLLKKNNGSIKGVVMDLLNGEKD
ncbi:unnamed protein product [Eruca vesicaria subsp. sativa]|uniref:Uncharacterized protein n=1 Tax=Eruca vesicaria subsp. sativa TaxID=29727 RepID=A0ABC8M9Y0_ERUVS|nr:unnamed protein product [Eruca vesicaria subsp. sativa]